MKRVWMGLCLSIACAPPVPQHPQGAETAQVVNASRVTQCAEEDNVYAKLIGEGLRSLQIEARHPSYMAGVEVDAYEPDFTACNFDGSAHPTDPKYTFLPKRVVLWETDQFLMIGNTHESFWRKNTPDFWVDGVVTPQVHLMQLYLKDKDEPKLGRHQFLVFYPPDGYWRAKPIPLLPLNYDVYGTSFLVGPIEEAVRPVVEVARVEFVPATMSFKLDYQDGSHGEMRITAHDRDKIALAYRHDRPFTADKPMAAIRSMYVTPVRSDTAEVSWRASLQSPLTVTPLMELTQERAAEVRFGRSVVANHNRSAPDMWFGGFAR